MRIKEGNMLSPDTRWPNFTDKDLDFVVENVAPDAKNADALKQLVRKDPEFRAAMVGDRNLLERVLSDEEIFLHISPSLYFEILLRQAYHELETITYTEEREGRASIPVFDTPEVLEFMERPGVVEYMASMMASFTRIQSYTVPVRVRKGIRRRVRYSDMDIDSLVKFASNADPEQRFGYYKRIADVCLFLSGVFPDSAQRGYGRMVGGATIPMTGSRRMRRTIEDYEREGRRFYGLAEGHPAARALELTSVFGVLRENFTSARKPLTFVATRFLHASKRKLFGVAPG